MTIAAEIASLAIRPILLGTAGAVFGIAGVIGPLLGGTNDRTSLKRNAYIEFLGVFTDHVSWRWCFYACPTFGTRSSF